MQPALSKNPEANQLIPLEEWKLLGPMTATNGVLLFGWSTAVIFEVLRKAMASKSATSS